MHSSPPLQLVAQSSNNFAVDTSCLNNFIRMMATIYLAVIIFLFVYKLWTINYNYWKAKGIPHIAATFPLGSSRDLALQSLFQGELWSQLYQKMAPNKYFGVYIMRTPFLVLRDPEVIRIVLASSFFHFRDRQPFKRSREPLTNHLFNLEGEAWRALRTKLTSTFTSGKLKGMFPLFLSCSETLDSVLQANVNKIIDVKDISARFSTDIIGTCAFGMDMNSISNPNSEFRKVGIEIFKPRNSTRFKLALVNTFPAIVKLFSPRFTPKSVEKFILDAVSSTIEHRMRYGIRKKDFIDLLMILKYMNDNEKNGEFTKIGKSDMTMEMMAAQCFVFFTAGFETSGSVQSCCLYELALNQDIQVRVQQEIEDMLERHGGFSYQAVHKMTYLDMVIAETMRKYPTLPILTRYSTEMTALPTGHTIDKGVRLVIPVWALHRDPKYFSEPDRFDPERFSENNVGSIKPFSYLPFGEGPRMCIGKRFGLLQTKMGLITVLKKYTVHTAESTQIPLEFSPTSILITATKGPIHLRLVAKSECTTDDCPSQ